MKTNCILFKKGDKVKVIKKGSNCVDANIAHDVNIMGVYGIADDWRNEIFEISGAFYPVEYDHAPEIYGAYPISLRGEIVGYVYNNALRYSKKNKEKYSDIKKQRDDLLNHLNNIIDAQYNSEKTLANLNSAIRNAKSAMS